MYDYTVTFHVLDTQSGNYKHLITLDDMPFVPRQGEKVYVGGHEKGTRGVTKKRYRVDFVDYSIFYVNDSKSCEAQVHLIED